MDCLLDQVLGLRPRNQHIGRNAKRHSVEFRFADDVLDRLTFAAAFQQARVTDRAASGEIIFRMRHQPRFIFADQMQQQRLCIALRPLRLGPAKKLRFALDKPLNQPHQAA